MRTENKIDHNSRNNDEGNNNTNFDRRVDRKDAMKQRSQKAIDFFAVRKEEFRALLRNICFYMKVYIMFDEMDTDVDKRLDVAEVHEFLNRLKEKGAMKTTLAESEQAFREMDLNGTGVVGFEEFCSW